MVPSSKSNPQLMAEPELEEDLERRILQRTWGQIHRLQIERQGDRLIVRGYSPSYYIKQLALSAVQEFNPVVPVQLEIQVGRGQLRPSEGRGDDWR
jgi:hypothetical protein